MVQLTPNHLTQRFTKNVFNILENWVISKIKSQFVSVLLCYSLYPAGSLLKNLLPLKFVFEPLVHCNFFLVAMFQDHSIEDMLSGFNGNRFFKRLPAG